MEVKWLTSLKVMRSAPNTRQKARASPQLTCDATRDTGYINACVCYYLTQGKALMPPVLVNVTEVWVVTCTHTYRSVACWHGKKCRGVHVCPHATALPGPV